MPSTRLIAFYWLVILLLSPSPAKGSSEDDKANESTTKKSVVAIIELVQETNSFSPVKTTLDNFKTQGNDGFTSKLMYNSTEILEHCTVHETIGMVAGFLTGLQEDAPTVKPVPILQARSVSGGPILRPVFDHFLEYSLEKLTERVPRSSRLGWLARVNGA